MMRSYILFFVLLVVSTEAKLCDTERDCRGFTSFCGGAFLCNQSAQCAAVIDGYDPCREQRAYALAFTRLSGGKDVVSIRCVEELKACMELYYCVEDSDCDDGLYCNGRERCQSGKCYPSKTPMCASCDERTRCGGDRLSVDEIVPSPPPSTTEEAADPGITYTVIGVSLMFITLVVIFMLILLFRSVDPSVMMR